MQQPAMHVELPYTSASWATQLRLLLGGAFAIGIVTMTIDAPGEGNGIMGSSLETLTTGETRAAGAPSSDVGGTSGGSSTTAETLPLIRVSEKTMLAPPSVRGVVGLCAQLTLGFACATLTLDEHTVCSNCAASMAMAAASTAALAAASSSHAVATCWTSRADSGTELRLGDGARGGGMVGGAGGGCEGEVGGGGGEGVPGGGG